MHIYTCFYISHVYMYIYTHIYGMAESLQMEFQVGARVHTHARTFCLLHARISCLARCVWGIFGLLM